MASLTLVNLFREYIGDPPVHTFNEATADGINASWVLTNSPVEPGSESLFLNGVLQMNGVVVATTTQASSEEDTSITVTDLDNIAVGKEIFLGSNPDPKRYKVIEIDTEANQLFLNRGLDADYNSGTSVYLVSKLYTTALKDGIIYFDSSPDAGVLMTCHYYYFKYSQATLSSILDQAIAEVGVDIGVTPTPEDVPAQRALVFLKAHVLTLNREVTRGAGSAIKVKQGSTSLDLVGANLSLQKQAAGLQSRYDDTLARYLMGLLDEELGSAILGQQDMVNG